jgi:hypothetical protein
VLVGLGAIADHKWKNMRSNRAELAEWYCEHQGNQCGGASSEGIEARWNERERAYVIAISVLGSVGVGLLGARRLRPQR